MRNFDTDTSPRRPGGPLVYEACGRLRLLPSREWGEREAREAAESRPGKTGRDDTAAHGGGKEKAT